MLSQDPVLGSPRLWQGLRLMDSVLAVAHGITPGIRLKTISGLITHPQNSPMNIPGSLAIVLWS